MVFERKTFIHLFFELKINHLNKKNPKAVKRREKPIYCMQSKIHFRFLLGFFVSNCPYSIQKTLNTFLKMIMR